jgi:UDP-N-acetylglucosamine 2-epimerase (non-hydrolysing)
MIGVVYGTTGELIKLSPVLKALAQRRAPTVTLCTGQQVEQIPALLEDFGLAQPDIWLSHRRRDLMRSADLPPWLLGVASSFARRRSTVRALLRSTTAKPLLIVHGDTLTTVLGAGMGRALGVPVAHIEAGMRSGDWRNPFPEELDRLATSRMARMHFAPGAQAAANLRAMRARGEIVDTGGNTISDAIELVPAGTADRELPREPFGLASLHRFELLNDARALRAIVGLLRGASRSMPILFIDHPVTVAAIAAHDLGSMFDDRLRRVPRRRYFNFVGLLKASEFLVTDSGGSQEECAYLSHPCLVHRAVTERADGLDGSVVLSRMDLVVAREFLRNPPAHKRAPSPSRRAPTEIIIEHLDSRGHIADLRSEPALEAAVH